MRRSAVPGTQPERVANKPDPPSWAPANEGPVDGEHTDLSHAKHPISQRGQKLELAGTECSANCPSLPSSPDAGGSVSRGQRHGGLSAPRAPGSCAQGQQVARPVPASSIFFPLIRAGPAAPEGRSA